MTLNQHAGVSISVNICILFNICQARGWLDQEWDCDDALPMI